MNNEFDDDYSFGTDKVWKQSSGLTQIFDMPVSMGQIARLGEVMSIESRLKRNKSVSYGSFIREAFHLAVKKYQRSRQPDAMFIGSNGIRHTVPNNSEVNRTLRINLSVAMLKEFQAASDGSIDKPYTVRDYAYDALAFRVWKTCEARYMIWGDDAYNM